MNTVEDFENAPFGATATHEAGDTQAMKTGCAGRSWVTLSGSHVSDKEMAFQGYTLAPSAPATAREALDLAWELAHEVKEGQVIPVGVWLVDRRDNKIVVEKNTFFSIDVDEWGAKNIRTLEPLPEPEPDWLDAPAVLATTRWCDTELWLPETGGYYWECTHCDDVRFWRDLTDVTPLYPKGQEA